MKIHIINYGGGKIIGYPTENEAIKARARSIGTIRSKMTSEKKAIRVWEDNLAGGMRHKWTWGVRPLEDAERDFFRGSIEKAEERIAKMEKQIEETLSLKIHEVEIED